VLSEELGGHPMQGLFFFVVFELVFVSWYQVGGWE
jgi:hypothetical protein